MSDQNIQNYDVNEDLAKAIEDIQEEYQHDTADYHLYILAFRLFGALRPDINPDNITDYKELGKLQLAIRNIFELGLGYRNCESCGNRVKETKCEVCGFDAISDVLGETYPINHCEKCHSEQKIENLQLVYDVGVKKEHLWLCQECKHKVLEDE